MPAFPRDLGPPQATSPFEMPGPLLAMSESGKIQRRSIGQVGRRWTEVYRPFKATSLAGRKFLATVTDYWRNGTAFDIEHYHFLTHQGGGSGTARVNGASQTGSTIATDGWAGSNPVLRAGDLIKFASLPVVRDVVVDAPNLVSGGVTLTINPPIQSGESPPDNDLITYTGVKLLAVLLEAPRPPEVGPNGYVMGFRLSFRELV